MDLNEFSTAVQSLSTLGDKGDEIDTLDYRSLGISEEDIPALIEIVRHTPEFWTEIVEEVEQPEVWTPMHAWRALGQFHATEAIPVLLDTLRLIDEEENDLIQEEFPETISAVGPAAIPAVADYLLNSSNGMWARLSAAEGLMRIGVKFPGTRVEIATIFMRVLEGYAQEDPTFNGFIISYLLDLKAADAAPLVEQAFVADKVDEAIMGDWEDYQVGVGLLDARLTPSRHMPSNLFASNNASHAHIRVEDKKTKSKRKQAEASRKKNRNAQKKKKKK
jgi:Protein of unknown function (DUF1186)